MGNGYRATFFNLIFKTRNDRTVRTQYIPEPRGNKPGGGQVLSLYEVVKRLHVFFDDWFGSPQDISCVNRLVRGQESEFVYAEFNREISQEMRAEDIGPNALAGVV